MERNDRRVDVRSFAVRRELRDILARLIDRGWWRPNQYEQALDRLVKQRKLALRQMLLIFEEGRVTDEVAALEILGRLATKEDDAQLAAIANSSRAFEGARVSCALVLLGHDSSERITAPDVSGLVLRWQARHLAEEKSMREPLVRLYGSAPREERARWIVLQEQEVSEPAGRAAIFEMLLEHEEDRELRRLLLEGLTRYPSPCARAVLQRVQPQAPEERESIMAALARFAADADTRTVPEGWSARVGFCDGSGSYPLRFDFRHPMSRERSVLFLLDLECGVREALALVGSDVARYDKAGAAEDGREMGSLHTLSVPQALGLLHQAERAGLRCECYSPLDFRDARQFLDPLADLEIQRPSLALSGDPNLDPQDTRRMLDGPGYAGWYFDAGDHIFDDLRLEVLRTCDPDSPPDADLVTRAAERLQESGEAAKIARRLDHNAFVHHCAGQMRLAATALATAKACLTEEFPQIPLVRRMMRESVHPGHFFFAPVPDCTQRNDLALLMLSSARPTRGRVLAVDLAWILTRATDVWLSRVPSGERPHGDHVRSAVLELAFVGARWVTGWMSNYEEPETGDQEAMRVSFGSWRRSLRERYRDTLREMPFPPPPWDAGFERLTDLLTWATETLVFSICLCQCEYRCPVNSRRSGAACLAAESFPAGEDAELKIRSWPGLYFQQPTSLQEGALRALVEASGAGKTLYEKKPTFHCGVCGMDRPITARSRSQVHPQGADGGGQDVCRRCQRRYRHDPEFRDELTRRLGPLTRR